MEIGTLPRTLLHAVATPLTVIATSLEAYQNTKNPLYLESCQISVKRLEELLMNKSDSFFCVKTAMIELESLLRSKIRLRIVGLSKISTSEITLADKVVFQEALICLLNNAAESYSTDSTPIIALYVHYSESSIQIDVIDSGRGMSLYDSIKALFFKWSSKHSGKGVGLAYAVQTLKRTYGARVVIQSRRQVGTRVTLQIPITQKLVSEASMSN